MIHRLGRSPALVTSGVFTSPIRDESPVNNALPSRSSKSLWKKLRSSQRSVSMPAGRIQYWSDRLNPMERSSSSFPEGMPVAMSSVRRPSLVAGIPRDRHHAVTESLSGRGCPSTYMPTGTRLGSNTSPTSRMRPAFDEYANSSTGWFRHIRTRFISNSIGPRDYGGWIHCFPFPMVATWMSFVHVDVPGETDAEQVRETLVWVSVVLFRPSVGGYRMFGYVRDAVSLACSCWKPSRPAKRVRPGRCRDRPAVHRPEHRPDPAVGHPGPEHPWRWSRPWFSDHDGAVRQGR